MHASELRTITTFFFFFFCFGFKDWLFWRRLKATENSFITETSSITWKLSLSCHRFWQCTFAFPLATSYWTIKGLLTTRLLCLIVWFTGGQDCPSLCGMMAKMSMQSGSVLCSNLIALLDGVLWRQSWLQKVWGNLQRWIWLCITCNVPLTWHGMGRYQGPLGQMWCPCEEAGLMGGEWLHQKVRAWLSGARSSCSGVATVCIGVKRPVGDV